MAYTARQFDSRQKMRCFLCAVSLKDFLANGDMLTVGAEEMVDNGERVHAVNFSNVSTGAVIM
jgi:hypothetical protein